MLLSLSGCGDDDPSTSTDTDATTTTTEQLEGPQAYVDSGNYETGLHLAKITKFDRDARTITYDVVQFLTGEEAKQAYEEDIGEAPDTDYYIRNQNTQTRSGKIAAKAVFRVNITGGYPPSDPDKGHVVDYDTFAAYFELDGSGSPYLSFFWLSLEDGEVIAIEEQYIS